MQALRAGWDFFQNEILGMKWLNRLIGSMVEACGLDPTSKVGGSVQFFFYDVIKIMVLLGVLILLISYIQSYFPPERTKKILGRFHGILANCLAALLGTVTPFCSCSSIPLFIGFDRPTWEKVQTLKSGTRRKRPTVTQEPSVFSGVMKCPECGGNLNFHFNQNNHDIKFFSCQNHNSGLRKCSSTHYIRRDFLEQVVLYEVHRLACFANEYENDFIKAMVGRSAKVAENERVRKKRELDALLARDRELDTLFERLYEDNVSGKIDDARFAKMAKRYEQEQGENAGRIKTLRLEVKKLDEKRMDVEDFLETVRRYTNATTITKRMVAELIDHIEVYPAVKEDGVTNQRVTIHYNCIGVFEVPDRRKIPERDILLETRRGVALSYAPAGIAV